MAEKAEQSAFFFSISFVFIYQMLGNIWGEFLASPFIIRYNGLDRYFGLSMNGEQDA